MKPRIAIWAAVSTPEQATVDKDSLPSQIRDGKTWANGVGDIVRVYEVPGHSRKYIHFHEAAQDVPEYAQLERDCQEGAFDVLWCRERSRLGRTDALIATVEAVVLESGAEVYSAAMPHQIGEATETSAIFSSAVERAMAQSENIQKRQRHATGMRARILRGLPGSRWPYGYTPVRDGRGKVIAGKFNEDEIDGVRLATQLYLEGKGYRAIALELNRVREAPQIIDRALAQAVPDRAAIEASEKRILDDVETIEEKQTRLALAVADGTINAQAARRANEQLVSQLDTKRAELKALRNTLATLPRPEEQRANVMNLLRGPSSLRKLPL